MDEGDEEDGEDGERLQRDAAIMEELMEGEIEGGVRKAKPVRQALFKVSPVFFFFLSSIRPHRYLLFFFNL